jgi:hypothetical protein
MIKIKRTTIPTPAAYNFFLCALKIEISNFSITETYAHKRPAFPITSQGAGGLGGVSK